MAIQGSGVITLQDIETEFGGAGGISLSEYYRGGAYVPNITANNSIPTSGAITMSNFYGSQSAFVCTVTEGSVNANLNEHWRGFVGEGAISWIGPVINNPSAIGSRTPTTFNGITIGVLSVFRDIKNNKTYFYLVTDKGSHTIRTKTGVFSSIVVEGGSTLTASSANFRAATAILFANVWYWTVHGTVSTAWSTWDGSGTRTVQFNEP